MNKINFKLIQEGVSCCTCHILGHYDYRKDKKSEGKKLTEKELESLYYFSNIIQWETFE